MDENQDQIPKPSIASSQTSGATSVPVEPQDTGQVQPQSRLSFLHGRKVFVLSVLFAVVLLSVILGSLLLVKSTQHIPQTYVISKNEIGKTITVKPGDKILLTVQNTLGLSLSEESTNNSVVTLNGGSYNTKSKELSGSITANKPGQADVYVIGKPICTGKFCDPLQVVVSKTHVIVSQ